MAPVKASGSPPAHSWLMSCVAWLVGLVTGLFAWAFQTARAAFLVMKIPGPFALPLIGNLLQLGALRNPYPFMFHRTREERITMREKNIRTIPMNRVRARFASPLDTQVARHLRPRAG